MFYQSQHSFNADGIKFENNVDYNFPAHLHNSFEFVNVRSGEMLVTVDKTTYTVSAGESILIFPNQVHELVTPNNSSHFLCIFSPKLVQAYNAAFVDKRPFNNVFALDDFYIKKLESLKDDYSIFEMKGILYSICGIFDRSAEYTLRGNDREKLLPKIFEFVDTHFSGECSLSTLSEYTSYHYVYLSKYFKNCIGLSFTDYVNRYRINEACYRFRNDPKQTVIQTAYECGFSSLRTFNRNFRRIVGVSPSQYQSDVISQQKATAVRNDCCEDQKRE